MPDRFKVAVNSVSGLPHCFQPGLQALGPYSNMIQAANSRKINGSFFIEPCLKHRYQNQNIWDYCVGYHEKAYFIEVHPAQTSEVETVLRKLKWLINWLREEAQSLDQIKADQPFHWIASGNFNILKGSKQYRKASQAGILPQTSLILK